jgi:hypothetical protein
MFLQAAIPVKGKLTEDQALQVSALESQDCSFCVAAKASSVAVAVGYHNEPTVMRLVCLSCLGSSWISEVFDRQAFTPIRTAVRAFGSLQF